MRRAILSLAIVLVGAALAAGPEGHMGKLPPDGIERRTPNEPDGFLPVRIEHVLSGSLIRADVIRLPWDTYICGRVVSLQGMDSLRYRLAYEGIPEDEVEQSLRDALRRLNGGCYTEIRALYLRSPWKKQWAIDWKGRLEAELWVEDNSSKAFRFADWLGREILKRHEQGKAELVP